MGQLDHAYHEAGHGVFAYFLGIMFVSIRLCDSDEIHDAHGCMDPGDNQPDDQRALEKWAQVAIAGPLAEKKLNPLSNWEQHGIPDRLDAIRKLCGIQVLPESEQAKACLDKRRIWGRC